VEPAHLLSPPFTPMDLRYVPFFVRYLILVGLSYRDA
jgi:hypothetical protein